MYRKWNLLLGDGPWRASPLKSKKHGCASGRPAIWFVFHPFYKRPENSASCQTDGFSSQSHRRFNQMQGMTIFIQKFRKLRRFQASVWKFLLSRHIFTCLCYIFFGNWRLVFIIFTQNIISIAKMNIYKHILFLCLYEILLGTGYK